VLLGGTAVAIAAGYYHTCALLTRGAVRCWGDDAEGQLGHDNTTYVGDGGTDPSIKEAGDVRLGGSAVAITAGEYHTCALLTTGAVRCWGYNAQGQLGYGTTTNVGDGQGDLSIKQAGDVRLGGTAVAVTAGGYHTCALMANGAVRCWGRGDAGQLGHDSVANIADGVAGDPSIKEAGKVPLGGTAVAVSAGDLHTCAVLTTGAVRCWGYGGQGQLGHDTTEYVGAGAVFGPSILVAGNVPVGVPVRVRATTGLSVRVRPARDRSAPYVYRVRGHLHGRFAADAATCTGRVTLTVRHGGHLLQRRSTGLRADCGYRLRTRLTAHQLPTLTTTGLTIKVRYRGSPNLRPSATTAHAKAH
jgi:hypothetical protein